MLLRLLVVFDDTPKFILKMIVELLLVIYRRISLALVSLDGSIC
jgi:hypothetical protein